MGKWKAGRGILLEGLPVDSRQIQPHLNSPSRYEKWLNIRRLTEPVGDTRKNRVFCPTFCSTREMLFDFCSALGTLKP